MMPRLGVACPRLGMAAGAPSLPAPPALTLYSEHELADVGARLHHAMGLSGLAQRKRRMDGHADRSGFEQRPNLLLHRAADSRLFRDRSGAQRRPGDPQPALQDG